MKEISRITFEDKTIEIEKEATNWFVKIKKSEATLKNEKEINLLKESQRGFLPVEIKIEEDSFDFMFQPAKTMLSFSEVAEKSQADKIRAASNFAAFSDYIGSQYTFFLDPENVLFDQNLLPVIAYRGLKNGLPPAELTEEGFLRQFKSIVIALFSKKQTFESLYNGNLERAKETPFIKTIARSKSVAEIVTYLEDQYQSTLVADQKNMRIVSKKRYMLYKQLTIWFSVVMLLLLIPLIYLVGFSMPHQTKLLQADTAFLKNDYEKVIQILQPIETSKIDATQKYELAYAYVQGKDLTEKQKAFIMKNISLKSADSYLTYWIENGRGNLGEALDQGKKLEDPDLILYGLQQKMEQVKNNPKLSGTKREKMLTSYQDQYDKYKEKFEKSEQEGQTSDGSNLGTETTNE